MERILERDLQESAGKATHLPNAGNCILSCRGNQAPQEAGVLV